MHSSVGIEREPPGGRGALRAAQAELDRFFPRNSVISWLLADWLSDDAGDPIERFVVYQMVPESKVHAEMRYALNGPHPWTLGHWRFGKWRSSAQPGLTARKWELWRRHRAEARLFWIVQGSGGGHRYRVNDPTEMKIRRQNGLPPDTPSPGALPFAPLDWRVYDNLLDLDQVRRFVYAAEFANRSPGQLEAQERDAAEDARRALVKWWGRQVDEIVDEAGMTGRGGWWGRTRDQFPRGAEITDAEQVEEEFITDRSVPRRLALAR